MKAAMTRGRVTTPALTAKVAPQLGLKDSTDKVRRWLANESAVDPIAIPVLARAVGVHPLEMLSAYGLVESSVAALALRLNACEHRFRLQRALLAEQHRAAGGALFAELALRHGGWAVTVVPHWRGRRCRYHVGDYALLDRRDGIADRGEAGRVFAEAFDRTGAEWDNPLFVGEPSSAWEDGRVYVPRLAAARAAEPYAAVLAGTRGIVVAGPRWAGMYTVAALVSAALGWGRESFDFLARSLNPGRGPNTPLASELLRGWLADPASAENLVWAHILADPAADGDGDIRLLASAPPDVQVVLLIPADGPGGGALGAVAELSGRPVAEIRASVERWRAALAERPGLAHLVVPAPLGRDGQPAGPRQAGFLDGFFDSSVDVALRILALLAGDAPAGSLVPAQAAAADRFAALAAGT